jgi:hypothetical protein
VAIDSAQLGDALIPSTAASPRLRPRVTSVSSFAWSLSTGNSSTTIQTLRRWLADLSKRPTIRSSQRFASSSAAELDSSRIVMNSQPSRSSAHSSTLHRGRPSDVGRYRNGRVALATVAIIPAPCSCAPGSIRLYAGVPDRACFNC